MRAITYDRYGPPEVLRQADIPDPAVGSSSVLIGVRATSVSTADWRMRASEFPRGLWLPGRLFTGLLAPRRRVLGMDFAGVVEAVGPRVTRFRPGDHVFGFSGGGAYAERLSLDQDAAIATLPRGLDFEQAASLPFGAISALCFLDEFARVRPGQRVLVVGASGGVGVYGVQIARALGAEVTGVASAANLPLVRELGAARAIDYRATPRAAWGADYDVVFETVGALSYRDARRMLKRDGLFLPLNYGIADPLVGLLGRLTRGPRQMLRINGDSREDLEAIRSMIDSGSLRPVIDRRYPISRVAEAHAYVARRHRCGAVVLTMEWDSAASPEANAA